MLYRSTRPSAERVSAAEAIKTGLASNGGLYMPEQLPVFDTDSLRALCGMSYEERAAEVLSRYLTDYTRQELLDDCAAAYSDARFPGGAAPVYALDDSISVLELWHGPTCAFKDMALQLMPRLLSGALKKTGEQRTAFILVATSGDTGKAALEGYRDAEQVRMMVFYPVDGVSRIQKLQMATQEGGNVAVQSVVGNFDDAQTGVKKIFSDRAAAERLARSGCFFSSANSINWGRLAPQIAYYFSAYCDMVNTGCLRLGDPLNVCVPTGNFGNIFAAYLAKRSGLPIGRLICASNVNNILTDFLRTGVYDRNRPFHTTMSPSMDILISSNLERLLYLCAGSEKTAAFMEQLRTTGRYSLDEPLLEEIRRDFSGYFCSEEQTARTIRETYEQHHYLIDPHTAVGLHCAQRYITESGDTRPMLTVSTASAYKFSPSVLRALGADIPADEFDCLDALSRLTGTPIPASLASLKQKAIRFDPEKAIKADAMPDVVFAEAER